MISYKYIYLVIHNKALSRLFLILQFKILNYIAEDLYNILIISGIYNLLKLKKIWKLVSYLDRYFSKIVLKVILLVWDLELMTSMTTSD